MPIFWSMLLRPVSLLSFPEKRPVRRKPVSLLSRPERPGSKRPVHSMCVHTRPASMCFYSSIALVVTEGEAGTECWRRWGRGGIIAGDGCLANTIFHHLVQIESLAILTRLQRVLKMCLILHFYIDLISTAINYIFRSDRICSVYIVGNVCVMCK